MDESECLVEFRFQKRYIPLLADVLQLPDQFLCYQRSVSSGIEGLCILLKRLSYPCRYMIARFSKPVPVLSMVSNHVLDYIYDHHSHRILNWNQTILSPLALQEYSDAISAKGAALGPICRPGELQRVVYNGHKRGHALKFQCVALPNELIGNLYGPVGTFFFLFLSAIGKNLKKYCLKLDLLRLRFECSEHQLCLHILQKYRANLINSTITRFIEL